MLKDLGKKSIQWMLREMAVFLVRLHRPTVIGVTGSVGKTTTKEMIWQVLGGEGARNLEKTLGNKNTEFGLPLSLLSFAWDSKYKTWLKNFLLKFPKRLLVFPKIFVAEMGADKLGDLDYLCKIAGPKLGVVTNVGVAHLEKFGTMENTVAEKKSLIENLPRDGVAILNADDALVLGMKSCCKGSVITYGYSESADVRIISAEQRADKLLVEITANNQAVKIELAVLGKHFAYAAAAAVCVGLSFGLSLSEIARRLADFKLPEGRSQLIEGKKGQKVIHDAYNANPVSVSAALESLADFVAERKIAILGDMLELGTATLSGHKEVGALAARCADILLAVGERAKLIGDEAQKYMPAENIYWLPNSAVAALVAEAISAKGDVILVKGSKAMKMRKVVEQLTDYKCEYE